tara:strand:- start:274 stop:456 length:183 start_codon:yes stop_codon:yes gene_type:complete
LWFAAPIPAAELQSIHLITLSKFTNEIIDWFPAASPGRACSSASKSHVSQEVVVKSMKQS